MKKEKVEEMKKELDSFFERLESVGPKIVNMTEREYKDFRAKLYTEGWGYYKTIVKIPQDSFNALSKDDKFNVQLLVEMVDDDIKDGKSFNAEGFIEAANFIYKGCDKSEGVKQALLDAFDYFVTYDVINDSQVSLIMSFKFLTEDSFSLHLKEKICDTKHTVVIKRKDFLKFLPVWNELRLTVE